MPTDAASREEREPGLGLGLLQDHDDLLLGKPLPFHELSARKSIGGADEV
jgi:hypothetical protein